MHVNRILSPVRIYIYYLLWYTKKNVCTRIKFIFYGGCVYWHFAIDCKTLFFVSGLFLKCIRLYFTVRSLLNFRPWTKIIEPYIHNETAGVSVIQTKHISFAFLHVNVMKLLSLLTCPHTEYFIKSDRPLMSLNLKKNEVNEQNHYVTLLNVLSFLILVWLHNY